MRVIETFVTSVPREKIPDEAKWFMQDGDGVLKVCRGKLLPKCTWPLWIRDPSPYPGSSFGSCPLSSDAAETVVTREELMRAYDLVEQGYTLWFGMPQSKLHTSWAEDFPEIVDVVLDGGVRDSGNPFAFNWEWRSREKLGAKTSSSIIAWRPHKPENDKLANEGVGIARAGSCSGDEVNHPPHYTSGNIECIDIIREMVRGKPEMEAACIANIVKYLYRYQDKGGIKSVEKAQWYLNLMIEEMKNEK